MDVSIKAYKRKKDNRLCFKRIIKDGEIAFPEGTVADAFEAEITNENGQKVKQTFEGLHFGKAYFDSTTGKKMQWLNDDAGQEIVIHVTLPTKA